MGLTGRNRAFVPTGKAVLFCPGLSSSNVAEIRCTNGMWRSGTMQLASTFNGTRVAVPRSFLRTPIHRPGLTRSTVMSLDPWSVSPEVVDQLAAQLFAASLFPYLAFLYFLNRERTDCPQLAKKGFRFLLVFVGATIPAGIYAKQAYDDILANVDWLHGSAESMLTVTNLLIVLGFRQGLTALRASQEPNKQQSEEKETPIRTSSTPVVTAAAIALAGLATMVAQHVEPVNALSLPTWIIHISSLLEWLAAMGLAWEYGNVTGRASWKGLVWAMLPLHTSGICACTYHLFYNAPSLNGLVALQAGLTCAGNTAMALATWRIANSSYNWAQPTSDGPPVITSERIADEINRSDSTYFIQLFVVSAFLSAVVKWGSLVMDWPFEPNWPAALALVSIPTALNMMKWASRSRAENDKSGGDL